IFYVAHSLRIDLDMLVVTASPARTTSKDSELTPQPPGKRHVCFADRTLISGRCFVLFLVALIGTVRASLGDVFIPKSGESVEGVAIEQDGDQFIVRPYIGDGSTITFLRSDLANVLPDSQETADFLALRTEATIKTALSSARFTELLERKI